MKTKTFIVPILFIFLVTILITSCESNTVNDEISNYDNEEILPQFSEIEPSEVQSPYDAEDEE